MIPQLKNYLEEIIKEKWTLQLTENKAFGDYSSNIAFSLAKKYQKSPMEVAHDLAQQIIRNGKEKMFTKIEAVSPGFINFWISPEILYRELEIILKQKNGLKKSNEAAKKINLEFVSANPTGPLTMANGRGGFYGDVLANVLEAQGNKVTREYYINDTGNQIKLLGESILAAEGKISEKEEYYKGDYIKELKGKNTKQAAAYLLKKIKASLKKAGIKHNKWFSEELNLHKKGELKKTLEFLKQKGLVKEKDGALWLGDGVLIKSDGNPTYFLADLAYHYNKFIKRKFDLGIDIWGADHHGYAERMRKGVAALGVEPTRLKIIITQLVRLVRGGEEIKMSKRKGEFVTMDELLGEVGGDAARFFFLMHAPETHMDFDLDLAKEQSLKNPVYYAQYAYVRAKSILSKSQISNRKSKIQDLKLLNTESELNLIKELVKFPDVMAQTAEDYKVNRLTTYTLELARALHNFYEKEKVLGVGEELEKARLALVTAIKIIFENLFKILGVSMPKKM